MEKQDREARCLVKKRVRSRVKKLIAIVKIASSSSSKNSRELQHALISRKFPSCCLPEERRLERINCRVRQINNYTVHSRAKESQLRWLKLQATALEHSA